MANPLKDPVTGKFLPKEQESETAEAKPVEDKYNYQKDHDKSWGVLAKETEDRNRKALEETKEEGEEDETLNPKPSKDEGEEKEEVKEQPKVPETPQPALQPDAEKIALEAAKKASEEVKKEFKTAINDILTQNKSVQDKQDDADKLIAAWTKENRLPKNYEELISETMRIADEKVSQRQRAEAERVQAIAEKTRQEEEEAKTNTQRVQQARQQEINAKIVSDLGELYEGNFLPKDDIKTPNNDNTETNQFLKFSINLQTERAKQGLPPVDSVSKIYFMHYKPYKDANPAKSNQPAGADAPVSGSKASASRETNPHYNYKTDHNKSWEQLAREINARMKQS